MPQKQFTDAITYNQSDIEQLGMCTVKLRHKDKCVKYRFCVVPGDCPALLGMLDIEQLYILRITCDINGEAYESSKFDLQTMEASNIQICRINETPQIKSDRLGVYHDKMNMPGYFRSSKNKASDIEARKVLTDKNPNEFSAFFQPQAVLKEPLHCRSKMAVTHIRCFKEG